MKHKDKVKIARKHRTLRELKNKVSIFGTFWWNNRKARIEREVAKRERNAKSLALLKKQQKEEKKI